MKSLRASRSWNATVFFILASSAAKSESAAPYLPAWTPEPAPVLGPIVVESDGGETTHKIASGGVTLGFSDKGGGYVNFCDLGDGLNIVSARYGRGWQGSIRDLMHSGRYNPTQAGYTDLYGAPAPCRIEDNRFIIEKYNLPLYGDPVNDFTEHEDLAVDHPKYQDNNNSDDDGLDETGLTQDDELRSDFDYAGIYEDASALTGNGIPAFRYRFFYAYAREPKAMLQFGKEARLFDGNPVFKEEYRVRDVSPDALPGDQTPADTDMSLITFSIYAIRLLKTPELDTKAALWRQDGEWIVLERKESGIKELEYLPNQRPGLKTIAGIDAYRPRNLDGVEMPLVVLANGMDPHKSRGIGLFIPNIGQNLKQIAGFDRETGELLYTEDRRLGGWFHLNWARGPHIMLVPRTTVLGMLAPGRAMPNAIETLYSEVYLLFGSPEEILQAARHIEQGG